MFALALNVFFFSKLTKEYLMMNENEAIIQFGPPNVPVAFFSLGQMPPGIQISFGLETCNELSILQLTERLTCWKYEIKSKEKTLFVKTFSFFS